jgi:hypothetical protein
VLKRLVIALTVSSAIAAAPAPAAEATSMRAAVADLAKDIQELLASRGEKSLTVGAISGPANFAASAGPGVQQMLADRLRQFGVTVEAPANLAVEGRYHLDEVPSDDPADRGFGVKLLAVTFELSVVDRFGKPVVNSSIKRTVRDESALLALVGGSAEPATEPEPRKRDEELRRILDTRSAPAVSIAGGRVMAKKGSPYAIELIVAGRPRAAELKNGLAFTGIRPGEAYAVRLINDSDQEAAAQLFIDGISAFAFSEDRLSDGPRKGEPRYSHFIVPPHASVVVRGWHRTNSESEEFLVTDYSKSAAAKLLRPAAGVGTVTAMFAASWRETDRPPADEPPRRKGTGFGARVPAPFEEVKREVGVVRAAVSVRYER